MPRYITEEAILKKLEGYQLAYEQAKKDRDANACHKLRSNISDWKSKYRQYLEDPEKYKRPEERPQGSRAVTRTWLDKASGELVTRTYVYDANNTNGYQKRVISEKKRELKSRVDTARRFYKEAKEFYGPLDSYTQKCWGEWKLAIIV